MLNPLFSVVVAWMKAKLNSSFRLFFVIGNGVSAVWCVSKLKKKARLLL